MSRLVVALFGAAIALTALASKPGFAEYRAVQESLRHLPPNMRFYELERRGFRDRAPDAPRPDSIVLSLVGKWGGGPSVKVTGRDSIVYLSRGSEVVAIDFRDIANPRVLSHTQVMGVVSRSVLVGDRLYVGSTGSDPKYIDVFDVSDAANPVRLGSVRTHLYDIDAHDSLVYALDKESLKIFSFADPSNPRMVGACRDSGYDISVCNGYAYLGDRWGLYVVDVRDPANPHRIGSWGTDVISVRARGSICCLTTGNPNNPGELRFTILDVRQPSAPVPLGTIDSCGGNDILLDDSLAFVSGYADGGHEFRILSVHDSTRPHVIGACATTGINFGVWSSRSLAAAFVADDDNGIAVIDCASPNQPVVVTETLSADRAYDVAVAGTQLFVADYTAGIKVLDLTDPASPNEVGAIDTAWSGFSTEAVAVSDSFAFAQWSPQPYFRSLDVSNPSRPRMAGGCRTFDFARAIVLRDTFAFLAERLRFQVINVARPRQPVLVGSCVTGDLHMAGLWLEGRYAYVAGAYDGIYIVDIIDPRNPAPVRILDGMNGWGCCVRDTLLYAPDFDDSLHIWNISNLYAIYQVGSVYLRGDGRDVGVLGNFAYVGSDGLGVVDIADPRNPVLVGVQGTPDFVRRVVVDSGRIYAAAWSGGVCIFDTVSTAVSERDRDRRAVGPVRLLGSVTRRYVVLELPKHLREEVHLQVYDIAGIMVGWADAPAPGRDSGKRFRVDLAAQPAGVYVVRAEIGKRVYQLRITKL